MIGIIELIRDVVKATSMAIAQDEEYIKFIFGNDEYVKDQLDLYSDSGNEGKFPLVVLFCPFTEKRGEKGLESSARINLLIACGSDKEMSNEQRLETSFKEVLRPIYDELLVALKSDRRFDFGYNPVLRHEYSENYSYGRYGAYTSSNKEVSEPIDAIDIRDLEIKVKQLNTCRNVKN